MEEYDVVIIGGGPAGLSCGIYCGRAMLKTAIIEKMAPGGQMATTEIIDNYPGFPKGADGITLAMDMAEQAKRFGVKTLYKNIVDIKGKTLVTNRGEEITAKAIVLAMGASPKELGIHGEKELRGRGVSYCATCDGAFFKDKTVAVVGGGDTAAADAVLLSKICKKVYLIHRRDKLRAAKIYESKLNELENVEFLWNTVVKEISGDTKVQSITVENLQCQVPEEISVDGIFVAVGITPETSWLKGIIPMNEGGFIEATEDTKTPVDGIFVAGDCRTKPLRQVVTAVSDGAVAAIMAEEYIIM